MLTEFVKKHPYSILVVVFALLAGLPLLMPGYFNMHDDLQMMRQLAFEECIKDGQIPCRWTPHMGYGYGFPLFNYYPPLPYFVGQLVRFLGFSFITSVKMMFFFSLVISGLTMYIFSREFWGKLGGGLSAIFYIWAPYHALDIYVRGAANEAWALAWLPAILWSSYKLIQKARFRFLIILTLSWAALFLSHNLMIMIFAPFFALWVFLWLIKEKSWFTVPQLMVAGVWSLGLSAFFTLPVLIEKNLVHVETLIEGYYEYIAHFVSVRQLFFSRFWGYGASVWGVDADKMSFQLGHTHWILTVVIGLFILFRFLKTRKTDNPFLVSSFLLFVTAVSTFMTHNKSTPIWQQVEALKFVQFPWRFITLSILAMSSLSGSIVLLVKAKEKYTKILALSLAFLVVLANKDFFEPESFGPLTDKEKFSNAAWDLQQTAGIYDYLPIDAKTAPKVPQTKLAEIIQGEGEITNTAQGTNWASFKTKINSQKAVIRINIFKFPDWRIFVDSKDIKIFVPENEEWGRMHIEVSQGEHEAYAKLFDTPARKAGNTISTLSWLLLLTAPIWRKKKKK